MAPTSNTGDFNTGDFNTGDFNTGYYNTGNRNTGYRNTGDCNTGHYNTGNRNTGDFNTGHYNTGDCNTGDFNTGNRNTGFFCTGTPSPMFFDHPTDLTWDEAYSLITHIDLPIGVEFVASKDMTDAEKSEHPSHNTIGGYLRKHERPIREVFPIAWAKMSQAERDKWTGLPNFDADKFFEITGVDVRTQRRVVQVRTVDGQVVSVYADEM